LRILVADDNQMVRQGVIELLSSEPKWEVCGEAKDGAEALQKTRQLLPDLLLLDVSMPGINGLEVTHLVRKDIPQTKILILTQNDPVALLPSVVAAGGNGCVDKRRLVIDLLTCIKSIVVDRKEETQGS
jgi:DNA-binding NarL/FixJ family response regulator